MQSEHAPLRTPEQVRAEFDARGQSLRAWARAHRLSPAIVYGVLTGAKKGRRGEAHRAAVLLGLKRGIAIAPDGTDAENDPA
ncbi:MAG: DNA-binding protein [Thermomonas hydrothermalis]|uniref:DNA-binding protein n=1 Tax=Thermomonas hydrothermalis TaxID=213588 RepID=UPI00235594D9|nr:DNA-binding protein [Thermomonas hydrothermalis]MCL6619952.1 DNA-binding protein [Thermomonas hydrothermalis]